MKIAIWTIVILVVAGGIGSIFVFKSDGDNDDATAVRLESVTRGELVEGVTAPGLIQPKTKVSISARVAARIVELPFDEGQRVTRGNLSSTPATRKSAQPCFER